MPVNLITKEDQTQHIYQNSYLRKAACYHT